jgi:hypothetical protein
VANLPDLEQTIAYNRTRLLAEANEHPHLAPVAAQADIRRLGLSPSMREKFRQRDVPRQRASRCNPGAFVEQRRLPRSG